MVGSSRWLTLGRLVDVEGVREVHLKEAFAKMATFCLNKIHHNKNLYLNSEIKAV